jgi:hypothetical protein
VGIFGQMFTHIEELYSSFTEVYGMLTKSEEHMEKVRKMNERYGVYRSGEGTPEEIMERRRELEEREYLEALFANNEYTTDTELNEKLH